MSCLHECFHDDEVWSIIETVRESNLSWVNSSILELKMKLRNKNFFQLHEQQLIEKRRKLPDKQRIIELELEHACLHTCHHMFPHWNNSISSTETKRFYSGPRSKLPSHACPALEYLAGLFVNAGIQILHDWVIFFSNVSSEKPHLRLSSAFANSMSFLYSHILSLQRDEYYQGQS